MAKTFLKNHAGIRNWAGVFLLFIVTLNASAQLDSASVSLSMTNEADPLDSNVMVDVLNVVTTVNDFDFFGELVVTVYDNDTDYPLSMLKVTKQEFIDEEEVSGNVMTLKIYGLDTSLSFKVITSVRNFQGANLPFIETVLLH